MGVRLNLKNLFARVREIAASPPVVGAAYVVALAVWAGQRGSGDDADLGDVRRADAVETFIAHRFSGEITKMKIGIVAIAIALGLLVGLAAEILVRLRYTARAHARRSSALAFATSLAVVAFLHATLVGWAMAESPQLYAGRWYASGGVARTAQVLATDVLGARGIVAVALVAAVLYIRPSRLAHLGRRVFFGGRRLVRGVRAKLAIGGAALVLFALVVASRGSGIAQAADEAPPKSPPAPARDSSGPPNVLILAADSLRADRLEPHVAPNLAALAARGTRFERAYVSLPRTFPSWVTILTGRHGHHHGVRTMFPTWEDRAKDFDALAGRFAAAGYATGVVSDYAGDIFGRIDLGFDRVETPSFDFRQLIRQRALERETPLLPVLHSQMGRRLFPVMRELSDAADPRLLADDVEATLGRFQSEGKDRPFFLTVFFSTAHFPYAAPAPYYAKYTDPAYRGRYKYHKPIGLADESLPNDEDVRQIRALYDGAVTAIDDAASKVLASLERLGVADRTIVVVTSDHGEMLLEQGRGQGHGDHLFGDEVTHVPLVIFDPRNPRSQRAMAIARDVDIAPTLYELAGVAPPRDLDGRSLAPALRGEPLEPRLAYAETELWFTEDIPGLPRDLRMPYPGIMALTELDSRHNAEIVLRREMQNVTLMARHRMARDERYKLVYIPTRSGVRYMLFDTKADPGETRDVASERPADVARLKAELWSWMLADPKMEQRDGFLVPRGGVR